MLYTKPLLTYGDLASNGEGFSNVEEIQCGSDPLDSSSRCAKGMP
jgi:hypothetical protein